MPNYSHLARAIQGRARTLGYTQEDLIQITNLGRTTVQRIWGATVVHDPTPKTKRALEDALLWQQGSVDAVLADGDPTIRRQTPDEPSVSSTETRPSGGAPTPTGLPLNVQFALGEGEVFDAEVMEWDVAGTPFSVILVAKTGSSMTEEERESLREQSIAWARMKKGIKEVGKQAGAPTDDGS